jgi:uncharacterized protein
MRIEKICWKSEGLDIRGEIYAPGRRGGPCPALVICHGIPGRGKAPDNDGGYPGLAARFGAEGFAVLIFNFRGTGLSGGNFDIRGWAHDLEAGLEIFSARPEVDPGRIFLLGFSGGGAVSIYVAARSTKIAGVVAGASPAEFRPLVEERGIESFLAHAREIGIIRDADFPPSLAAWARNFSVIRPLDWVDKIPPRPLLLLHGTDDEVVPVSQARALYEKVRGRAELCLIEGGEHRLRLVEKAMKKAMSWLKERAFRPGSGDPAAH